MVPAAQKVSILIPAFNREHCIAQTLESALRQTHKDIEVVLVDNASTDATWTIACRFAIQDGRVKVFRNDSNIGPVRNWLKCVEHATGDYVKILWSDDLLHPSFIEKALPCMASADTGFVYSAARVFSGNDPEDGDIYYTGVPGGRHPCSQYIEGALLAADYPVSPGCALFRTVDVRECLLKQIPNRVNSDFSMHAIGNDLLLFLLVAARYPAFHVLPEPLSYFRSHPGSITVSAAKGRIPLHYDIAKAYFVARTGVANALHRKFNAILLLHLLIFDAAPYGIRGLADFYPQAMQQQVDYVYLLRVLIGGVFREITRRVSGRK